MTYRGRIRNGVAEIDSPIPLPDGTEVRIEVESNGNTFWQSKTVADLVREQGVPTLRAASELTGDWPEDDSIDDFLTFIREARR
jgi:hypothetical protein